MRPLSSGLHLRALHLLLAFCTPVTSQCPNGDQTCRVLASRLPDQVTFPGDEGYDASLSSYAYLQQQTQSPSCVVKPTSAAEVAFILDVLRESPSTTFAVRSGGHATNRGFSNIDGGVTIDLGSLNKVDVHDDGVTVSVGTGATWGHVYPVLDAHNRSLNGGRASDVGVGGFLSGGGIGFFSLEHGFGCDAVVNMEVVLSSGDVINANATSHRKLFKALKGGQNNLGIVTRWDLTTVHVPEGRIWGGTLVYPTTTTDEQLEAFTNWKTGADFDPRASAEQSHVYIGSMDQFLVATSLHYTAPVEFPESLRNFTAIQPQWDSTLRIAPVAEFAAEVQAQSTPNQYSIFATTTIKISPTILKTVHALWQDSVRHLSSGATVTSSMTLQSLPAPPPADEPYRENSFGFDPSSTPQKDDVLVLISNFWDDPSVGVGTRVREAARRFIASVDSAAEAEGLAKEFKYMNYAGAGFQSPLESTGQLGFLRRVARCYDGVGMFQRQAVGGWKFDV
ncbi:FAD-binding domain-containing protein [Sodiomyces alkalinus F11]|uniref:FAD-binding domain-containing protein n=1 Tax=Sodiomyces alkalinus (strain CBS 110278 / VKM F-3762 / F11) TaxID=1314773 RepID=A0A3N2PTI0_SODAK|nr:FAD-binding domain-containing protein [Sodiomyces alkalinus F11]ROT37817.1 FAD-binding domain-containing protein [Sodiomyces alkalinus F11]